MKNRYRQSPIEMCVVLALVLALELAAGACSGGSTPTSRADGAAADQGGGNNDGPLAGSGGAGTGGTSGPGGGGLGGNAGRDGGPTPSDSGPQACNNLTQLGTTIKPTVSATPRPATDNPAGGKIEDGTYTVTGLLAYNVPPGKAAMLAEVKYIGTLRITGNSSEWLLVVDTGRGPKEARTRGTMTGAGTRLSLTLNCPSEPAREVGYTSTGNEIRIYEEGPASAGGDSDGGSGGSGSGSSGLDGGAGVREEMIMVLKKQ